MTTITFDGTWDGGSPVEDIFAAMDEPSKFMFAFPGRWPIPGVLTFGTVLAGVARIRAARADGGEGDASMTLQPVGTVERRRAILWRGRRVLASWAPRALEVPHG